MKQEINPKNTSRAQAFELWMKQAKKKEKHRAH
jgi:hypothetical protein